LKVVDASGVDPGGGRDVGDVSDGLVSVVSFNPTGGAPGSGGRGMSEAASGFSARERSCEPALEDECPDSEVEGCSGCSSAAVDTFPCGPGVTA
jgi:hypothetical protein